MKQMQASEYRKDYLMEKWSHSSSAGLPSGSAIDRSLGSSVASVPRVGAAVSIATTLSRQSCDLGTKRSTSHIPAQTATVA
jgi:hypothetical protein